MASKFTKCPVFNGDDYGTWKNKMMHYVKGNDFECWRIIVNGPLAIEKLDKDGKTKIDKPESEYGEADFKIAEKNSKAMSMLQNGISEFEYSRISACSSAKEIWDSLELAFEGTSSVKQLRIALLTQKYEYGERPRARDFEIYAEDATFEDPLMRAHGVKQIKSAFYSIPKIFSESGIVEYTVKEEIISPGKHEILIDNKQHYKFWGKNIDMISLIVLSVEEGKVVQHEDRWDKKPLRNRENLPVFGRLLEMTRRGSMLATHAMMGFGKDPFS